jgi:ABC-type nitrate/sulfonate/bicarbonate transport system substrate-binding protein
MMITEISASREWAEANREVVEGYLRAVTRAVEYARDPATLDDAVERISRLTDTSPEAVRKGLDVYLLGPSAEDRYFPRDFNHDDEAFENTIEAYIELGTLEEPISEEEYMDYSYVEAALSQ